MHIMMHALLEDNVYVEPAMQPYADPAQVSAALRATSATHLNPRVVVLERLPSGESGAGPTAQQVYQTLGAGKREFVVLVAGYNVAAQGAGLSREELDSVVQSAARTFDSESYAAGIAQIVRAADQKRGQHVANLRGFLLVLAGLVAGGFYLVMRSKRKRNTTRLNEARERAHELSVRLELQLQALHSNNEYSLPNEDGVTSGTQALQPRRAAAQSFSSAMQLLDNAQTADEYEAAFHALQSAETALQQARIALESQTLNEDENAVLDESVAPGENEGLGENNSLDENSSTDDEAQHPIARPVAQDALSST